MIDVNVHVSRWPFRRLPCDETPALVKKLKKCGIRQAWAGSFDGLLQRDIAGVNNRLAGECQKHGSGFLIPFGCVNPTLPDWREDVRRVDEEYRMPGVRLYPGYHDYALDAPVFAELLALAERRGLIVQLAVRMEDTRTHHPLMLVPDVDVTPLPDLLAERPQLRLIVLNALRTVRGEALMRLVEAGNVHVEISMLEGMAAVETLLRSLPLDRILFGSHFPFFVLESALLKLQESDLTSAQIEAITHKNAERLLQT